MQQGKIRQKVVKDGRLLNFCSIHSQNFTQLHSMLLQPVQTDERTENAYNVPEDVDDADLDQGPDLDSLLDRMLTLTPDTHPPTEDPGEHPPALPPKMSRKQNGVVPHTTEDTTSQGADDSGIPPEVPPRREKKESNDSTVSSSVAYVNIVVFRAEGESTELQKLINN